MNRYPDLPIAQVALIFREDTLIPDAVTAIMGIPPTRSYTKGDITSKRSPKGRRPWGLWSLEFEGTDVQEVATKLLDTLHGREGAVKKLANMPEMHISVSIWWEPPEGQGGFTIPSAILAQLCALSTEIHIYFPG